MNLVKYLTSVLLLMASIFLIGTSDTIAQLTVGNDKTPASNHVIFWNASDSSNIVQLTNVNSAEATWVHFQTFDAQNGCTEQNEFICLTPGDTIVLNDSSLLTNSNHEGFSVLLAVVSNDANSNGVVDCAGDTPTFVPRDFDSLIGTSWIVSDGELATNNSSIGRSLVNGVYESIQPDAIVVPYTNNVGGVDHTNFITVAWTDAFTPGVGAYEAEGGTLKAVGTDAAPFGRFVFNDSEFPRSCGDLDVACALCRGPHNGDGFDEPKHDNSICTLFDEEDKVYVGEVDCDVSTTSDGYTAFLGVETTTNTMNLVGPQDDADHAGLSHAIHIALDDGEEPPVNCDEVEDVCAEAECVEECQAQQCVTNDDCSKDVCDNVSIEAGSVCSGGEATETDCTDESGDEDGDGNANCDDVEDCASAPNCIDQGGQGGGSGGCSVATAATGLGSMANALVLLIPAFGIGARRIRQRLNK